MQHEPIILFLLASSLSRLSRLSSTREELIIKLDRSCLLAYLLARRAAAHASTDVC